MIKWSSLPRPWPCIIVTKRCTQNLLLVNGKRKARYAMRTFTLINDDLKDGRLWRHFAIKKQLFLLQAGGFLITARIHQKIRLFHNLYSFLKNMVLWFIDVVSWKLIFCLYKSCLHWPGYWYLQFWIVAIISPAMSHWIFWAKLLISTLHHFPYFLISSLF